MQLRRFILFKAMDIKSPERRSQNMAKIRSRNTKPEVYLRKLLFKKGYRYSLNKKGLPGTPDLYFRKYNTVIFVHGCFWHRHQKCKYAYMPKSNIEFWQEKFNNNIERDKRQLEELEKLHIRVLIVWECTIRKMKKEPEFENKVITAIEEFLADQDRFKKEL